MAQLLVIVAFLVVYLRETTSRPLFIEHVTPLQTIAITLGGMFALWLMGEANVRVQARRLDRWGSWRAVLRAEQVLRWTRACGLALHAIAVLGLGWLDAVRLMLLGKSLSHWPSKLVHASAISSSGDVLPSMIVDTLIAVIPILTLLVMGWWSFYAIERRLREATLLREIENGQPIVAPPTRAQYVVGAVRHQLGLVVIPIVLIAIWNGIVDRTLSTTRTSDSLLTFGARLAGVAVILVLMPFVMRRVWDTVALGPGPLRERLLEMCRAQKVRVRDVIVWRTHDSMINGAVMGFFSWARYILLTDALLHHLPQNYVEAVTAHELGHVRRKHMLWLAINGIGAVMLAAVVVDLTMRQLPESVLWSEWATLLASGLSTGMGLFVFGFASRRFEWQADAFAVQHLSRTAVALETPSMVQSDAIASMSGSLEAVARLNHIPRERSSWRHGSIATRQRKLAALLGQNLDRLKPDRDAGFVKLLSVGMLVAAIAGMALIPQHEEPEPMHGKNLMRFVKMHGVGNDYVYLDAVRSPALAERTDLGSLSRAISDRHRGVGSDGLILVCRPSREGSAKGAHVRMRMFNADGSESEMCGNGLRCVAKFAHDRLDVCARPMLVETGRGVLSIDYETKDGELDRATVDMGEPILEARSIPVVISGVTPDGNAINLTANSIVPDDLVPWLESCAIESRCSCVSMGNPHLVLFCGDPDAVLLEVLGPRLEKLPQFPNRANIHFVRVDSRSHATMRTWERGAGITQACGTGACAAHVAGVLMDKLDRRSTIRVPGGELSIMWDERTNHVFMSGPARDVFEGDWPEDA